MNSDSIIGLIAVLSAVAIGLISLVRGAFFSPLCLYFFTHLMAFGFCLFGFLETKSGFTTQFYFVLAISHLAFICGYFIARSVAAQRVAPESGTLAKSSNFEFMISVCFAGLAILLLYWMSRKAGGWPLLSRHPGISQGRFGGGRFDSLMFSTGTPAALLCIIQLQKKFSWLCLLAILVIAAFVSLTGSRGFLIMFIVYFLAYKETVKIERVAKQAILASIVAVSFFVIVGYFRYQKTTVGSTNLESELVMYQAVANVYQYLCNGYWNFGKGVARYYLGLQPTTWGFSSFSGFWYWITNIFVIQESFGWDTLFNHSIIKYSGLNSVAYQWPILKDFGLIGMAIGSALCGYITSIFYYLAPYRKFAAYIYPYLSYQIIFSFNIFWPVEGIAFMGFVLFGFTALMIVTHDDLAIKRENETQKF
jgi:oligosaccharide repeat unit polymerase